MTCDHTPIFYTVKEAAVELRVDPATLYRAIREDGFPAVRIRSRYIVPRRVLDDLVQRAAESGGLVDPRELAKQRQAERELDQVSPGWRR